MAVSSEGCRIRIYASDLVRRKEKASARVVKQVVELEDLSVVGVIRREAKTAMIARTRSLRWW